MDKRNTKVFSPPLTNKPSIAEINKTCMFTGHRSIYSDDVNLLSRLVSELETLINVHGINTFVAGGARGFDVMAESAVVRLRCKYPHIKLILALPCLNQTAGWSYAEKAKFDALLEQADEIHYVNLDFFPSCMHRRNDYMVERAAYCISYLRHSSGGTAYTVAAAEKLGLQIIKI